MGNILGFSKGFSQSPALPYGIKRIAFVLSNHIAFHIYEVPPFDLFLQSIYPTLEKRSVIIVRNKANLVTIPLFRQIRKSTIVCHLSDLRLRIFSQRKERSGHTLLTQSPQNVGLIFISIPRSRNIVTPILLFDSGIMPRGYIIAIQLISPLK